MLKKLMLVKILLCFSASSILADTIKLQDIEAVGNQAERTVNSLGNIFKKLPSFKKQKKNDDVSLQTLQGERLQHAPIPNVAQEQYTIARDLLLASGWQPRNTIHHFNEDKVDPQARLLRNMGYIEIRQCAGTGLAPCLAVFNDVYGNGLVVSTLGEWFEGGDIIVDHIKIYSPEDFDEELDKFREEDRRFDDWDD